MTNCVLLMLENKNNNNVKFIHHFTCLKCQYKKYFHHKISSKQQVCWMNEKVENIVKTIQYAHLECEERKKYTVKKSGGRHRIDAYFIPSINELFECLFFIFQMKLFALL